MKLLFIYFINGPHFFQTVALMRRTVENIKDPLFRFFEREVNAGSKLLSDVREDMQEVMQVCLGEQKATNHHRQLIAELAKGRLKFSYFMSFQGHEFCDCSS